MIKVNVSSKQIEKAHKALIEELKERQDKALKVLSQQGDLSKLKAELDAAQYLLKANRAAIFSYNKIKDQIVDPAERRYNEALVLRRKEIDEAKIEINWTKEAIKTLELRNQWKDLSIEEHV
ncbi:hypothetical protein [Alkalicoccobacillus murimartini]|uniref:Uncharacterized protein n=1 Tax=Alkalicoccobacillus murimartini TaxID=171685 RepID=A0ABT9YN34_9BACI|nr:hypothetical protein [Alkalicoccobacillus murimartini]MDQ0208890.1 hypothetical protein [Alkalicoccobacillus murimartini]